MFQLDSLKEQNYASFDFLLSEYVVTLNGFLTKEPDLENFKLSLRFQRLSSNRRKPKIIIEYNDKETKMNPKSQGKSYETPSHKAANVWTVEIKFVKSIHTICNTYLLPRSWQLSYRTWDCLPRHCTPLQQQYTEWTSLSPPGYPSEFVLCRHDQPLVGVYCWVCFPSMLGAVPQNKEHIMYKRIVNTFVCNDDKFCHSTSLVVKSDDAKMTAWFRHRSLPVL